MSDQAEEEILIRLMKDRTMARIPLDKIVVVNSRDRDQKQFDEIVRSIKTVELLIPIIVNKRFLDRTGVYELVCGEGRLLAFKRLKMDMIDAEIIDEDRKRAHLMSLIENITRVPPGTIWFANEALRMRTAGMTLKQIGTIVGRSEGYVSTYVLLAEKGEARLIRGVEHGLFPMAFAHRVAVAGDAEIQRILMDAYDANIVTSANFTQIKRILNNRIPKGTDSRGTQAHATYTVGQLKRDIARVSKEKEGYVREAERKENRLFSIIEALDNLMLNSEFMSLLRAEELHDRPVLSARYVGSQSTDSTFSQIVEGAENVKVD